MASQYIILSRILDYLRVDKDIVEKISNMNNKNKEALYLYDIMQVKHNHIVKNGVQIYTFKYQIQLPKLYYTSYNGNEHPLFSNNIIVDFAITLCTKEMTEIDNYCVRFLKESNYLNKTDLAILLLIMTLPDWHIGVYPPNKGENKHR